MIARRRWLGAEPSKSLGLILSAQISASLNSGKIRGVGLHKRDNQPHRDQGLDASHGDAEIKTAHDALRLVF